MLTALLVVGDQTGLISSTDLTHFDSRPVIGRQIADKLAEVDSILGHVEECEDFLSQNGIDIHDLHVHVVVGSQLSGTEDELGFPRHQLGIGCHVLGGRDAEDPPPVVEGEITTPGIVDVAPHLLTRDRLPASGVGAGGGQHLDQFESAMGSSHQLAATAGLEPSCLLVFANHLHGTELDDNRLRWFQSSMLLFQGHRISECRVCFLLENRKWNDTAHGNDLLDNGAPLDSSWRQRMTRCHQVGFWNRHPPGRILALTQIRSLL